MIKKKTKSKFSTQKMPAIVHLKEWLHMPDSKSYIAIGGLVTILKDTDVVGFEVHKSESNWAARIESDDGRKSVNMLGCQIRAITVLEDGFPKHITSGFILVNDLKGER